MAVTYVTITKTNYMWFGAGAVVCGILGFVLVGRFDYLRRKHVYRIPAVGADGAQLLDKKEKPVFDNVVIGTEANMRPEALKDLQSARAERGGISLGSFMSGCGAHRVNDPEALWDRTLLSKIANELTLTLMGMFLFAVLALYLASFVVEITQRAS